MNPELQNLLHRWRENSLTTEEMRALTAELNQPAAREALRRDWFLEAALPQSLAASLVIVRTPQPSFAAKMRAWAASWFTLFAPGEARGEEPSILALRLWARASFAALAVGLITASWLVWPQQDEITADVDAESEPAFLAQLMIETHLPDAP
jgi:hypothetical protein